ncbi:MAG: YitT family protein [Lachnospiraceae bacterium]
MKSKPQSLQTADSPKHNDQLKNFIYLTASTLIMAVGVYFFKFSNNFTFGGITGLAVLIAKSGIISASDFSFVANMILLVIGFFVLGKKFAAKTAYSSILLSVTLSALERIYPMSHPLTDQPLMELAFAIALPSIGSAVLFNIGASSGGTDVIAMIMKKYTSFNIGNALMITDFFITLAGFFVFDIETGLYSFLGLTLRSFMIDGFIESLNLSKYFNVVCNNPKPICEYIKEDLHRSATIVLAQGAFSGEDKYIIFTVLNRVEAVRLRNYIKENSPDAFLLISNTSEIIGKGFHSV